MSIEVVDHPEKQRYEAREDGEVVGFAAYRRHDDVVVFTHTEVDDRQEGKGVGSTLVRTALDDVRRQGLSIEPRCPFVKAWVDRHPDYQDLLAA